MSRATIVTVSDGDTNDVAVVNPAFTSWNSATAAIDATNVREEGIGRRNIDFATNIFHKSFQFATDQLGVEMTGDAVNFPAAPINHAGPTPIELTYDMTGYEAASLTVRCSFEYETTVLPTGSSRLKMYARLYHHDGGSWSALSTSTIRILDHAMVDRGTFGPVLLLGNLLGKVSGKIGLFAYVTHSGGSSAFKGRCNYATISIDGYKG